jgi:hypothetical protein
MRPNPQHLHALVTALQRRSQKIAHQHLWNTFAAFNVLVQRHGLQPNTSGVVPLSIAEFSL